MNGRKSFKLKKVSKGNVPGKHLAFEGLEHTSDQNGCHKNENLFSQNILPSFSSNVVHH